MRCVLWGFLGHCCISLISFFSLPYFPSLSLPPLSPCYLSFISTLFLADKCFMTCLKFRQITGMLEWTNQSNLPKDSTAQPIRDSPHPLATARAKVHVSFQTEQKDLHSLFQIWRLRKVIVDCLGGLRELIMCI